MPRQVIIERDHVQRPQQLDLLPFPDDIVTFKPLYKSCILCWCIIMLKVHTLPDHKQHIFLAVFIEVGYLSAVRQCSNTKSPIYKPVPYVLQKMCVENEHTLLGLSKKHKWEFL